MIKCSFCGYEFSETEAAVSCAGCVRQSSCGRRKCPHCGYEILKEPGIISWWKKWREGRRHVS